jgi:Domain of unknown function (DUF4402)
MNANRSRFALIKALLSLSFALPAFAQHSHTNIIESNLVFGSLLSTAVAGGVTVNTAGARTSAGGVTLINNPPAFSRCAVHLQLNSGPAPNPWIISTSVGSLNLTGPGAPMTCTLTAPSLTTGTYPGPLPPLPYNTPTSYVGGTLAVGANQTAGTYQHDGWFWGRS